MAQYHYLCGSRDSRETVTFDITRQGRYITTCVVDVDLLIGGMKAFPCGNGDDEKLSPQQQLDILELVWEERGKITGKYPVKTYKGWQESGLRTFEDYCFPGDVVDGEIVEHFVNSVPPVFMRSTCTQAGAPYSHEKDEQGVYRPTYATFHRITDNGSLWRFDGYCFCGRNENRRSSWSRLEECIAKVRSDD